MLEKDFPDRECMNAALEILLRIVGAGLVMLAFLHIPIDRKLWWREEGRKLSPENEQAFLVQS